MREEVPSVPHSARHLNHDKCATHSGNIELPGHLSGNIWAVWEITFCKWRQIKMYVLPVPSPLTVATHQSHQRVRRSGVGAGRRCTATWLESMCGKFSCLDLSLKAWPVCRRSDRWRCVSEHKPIVKPKELCVDPRQVRSNRAPVFLCGGKKNLPEGRPLLQLSTNRAGKVKQPEGSHTWAKAPEGLSERDKQKFCSCLNSSHKISYN